MTIAIAIPARYGSTRFPGKPLAKIGGQSMLSRVVDLAQKVAAERDDISVFVTTDDHRIEDHARAIGAACIMTPESCATGSDRVLSALRQLDPWPDFVLNLQGDAPFTPISVVQAVIDCLQNDPHTQVATPVHRLSWDDLDRLRAAKTQTPFSGTTAVVNDAGHALWFSKNILPAIRKEDDLRTSEAFSPVYQHIGLYGYRVDILEKF
ncbi:MAG: cytidylyltransferase domain-containing protein, partial [Bdellovibrionales bacterium]